MVGCVLVRNRHIIGEGYHRRFGGPHAEIEALRSAKGKARGATAYVTLEPCCHYGKTPPCTDALIAAGAWDPNGALTRDKMQYTLSFLQDTGAVPKELRVDDVADLAPLNDVLNDIGRQ